MWRIIGVAAILYLGGCVASEQRKEAEKLQALSLADLSNPNAQFAESVVLFEVEQYYFSPAQYPSVLSAVLQIANPPPQTQAFDGCGIRIFGGKSDVYASTVSMLTDVSSGFAGTNTLMLTLNQPFTTQTATIQSQRIVDQGETIYLSAGILGWSILPRLADLTIEKIQIKIGPFFEPYVFPAWPAAEDFKTKLSRWFSCGFLETELQRGDFLVLMPKHPDLTSKTDLERILFAYPFRADYDVIFIVRFVRVIQ